MKALAQAMLQVQRGVAPIVKNRRGHNSRFADLEAVLTAVRPLLCDAGLVLCHTLDRVPDTDQPALRTVLLHADSGEWIDAYYPLAAAGIKGANDAQQAGAAITYARRYSWLALFSVATTDDDAQSVGASAPARVATTPPAQPWAGSWGAAK
jgi:hypothetical protein